MAYIDPDGMFSGDRMALLSDAAKLHWPYFLCASNTLGRLELNYRKLTVRAFGHFNTPPTEQQFWAWAREYRDCYLLYIYKSSNGQVWGQWNVSERYLPTYKTKTDRMTPTPDGGEFSAWQTQYVFSKENGESCKSFAANNSEQKKQNLQTSTDRRGMERNGEEETNTPQPPFGGLSVVQPILPKKQRPDKRNISQIETALGVVRLAWWIDWWSIYPCHEDKRSAMDAFERTVTTLEVWAKVRAGAVRYRAKADSEPDMKLKYGQGWIHGERWEDEYPPARASPVDLQKQTSRPDQSLIL